MSEVQTRPAGSELESMQLQALTSQLTVVVVKDTVVVVIDPHINKHMMRCAFYTVMFLDLVMIAKMQS